MAGGGERLEPMAPAPTVIAHRGAREAARENTLPAFRLARELGAEWVELDVRRTTDGVAVVHHDAQLEDGRLLAELSVEELPEFIPSLAEALEACEGLGVNIEIKNLPSDPDYDADHLVSDAVAGLVQAYLGPANALVSSFNIDTLDRLHAVDPTIPLAYLFAIGDPVSAIDRALAHEMSAIHPYDPLVTESLVQRAHAEGLQVNVWTVNDPDRIGALADMGVDGICTDVPDVARRVLDERSAPES
jgi:glycerophosphoryl diester phosphodiesterase